MQELNISCDEDFILAILAVLRGDEKELPFMPVGRRRGSVPGP